MQDFPPLPVPRDVAEAAARIGHQVRRTPVMRSASIDAEAGCRIHFKCENLQRVGAFKFRGASNAVLGLDPVHAQAGVVTQSSGNHGAAVALACRLRGIPATVVVPEGAPRVKVEAIRRHGARLVRCAPGQTARDEATAGELARTGGALVHPFDDGRVIAGQGTAALELLEEVPGLAHLLAPVSGGGLLSGTLLAAQLAGSGVQVVGAEPAAASDAHESLRRGERVRGWPIDTICDGLRAELGALPFRLLRDQVGILLAEESEIIAAMRMVWERMKLVIEPSCAVPLAVVLNNRERFAGAEVGIILSGGNVDLDALPWVAAPA